jgi:hypothetical protein
MAESATMQDVRIDPRFPAAAVPGIKAVKLSPGDTVTLVNISATGVLVEGKMRFVPSTRVTVSFEGGFVPAQVRGRVVRCQVASIAGGRLQYQSGIAFDSRIELPGVDALGASTAALPTPADATARGGAAGVPSPGEIRNRW